MCLFMGVLIWHYRKYNSSYIYEQQTSYLNHDNAQQRQQLKQQQQQQQPLKLQCLLSKEILMLQ